MVLRDCDACGAVWDEILEEDEKPGRLCPECDDKPRNWDDDDHCEVDAYLE